MAFCRHVLFVLKQDRAEQFLIERPEKFGGNVVFSSYTELESAYKLGNVHPMDLKNTVAREIDILLAPLREHMKDKQNMIKAAYPEG